MTVDTEPLNHHEETSMGDFEASHDCLDEYTLTDGFAPSLPALVNRAPDADTDARSVSDVGSVSNGDTVSDPDGDFDEIGYDEIPALAARARHQEPEPSEEDMERTMMSDRTIIPNTPTLAQRMPQLSSEATTKPAIMPQHARLTGLSLAEKPYQLPKQAPCLVYVGDHQMSDMSVALAVAKIVGAMTGGVSNKESVLKEISQAKSDDIIMVSWTPINFIYAKTFGVDPTTGSFITLPDHSTLTLKSIKPDLVILHRESFDNTWVEFAKQVAHHKIPMLEITDKGFQESDEDEDLSCIIPHTTQANHCLRLSLVSGDGDGNEDEKMVAKEMPLSLGALHALDDDVLSRHIAYLADRPWEAKDVDAAVGTGKEIKLPSRVMSFMSSLLVKSIMQSLFALFMTLAAASLFIHFLQQQSPASELALRAPMLQVALNNSGLSTINATDILHYPTTTGVSGNSTTTAVAFPTAVHVHVAKSDQLLVSLPKAYWNSAQIGVFKNGKALSNVNNTRVIDGVLSVSLPSADANGQVQVSVLTTSKPFRNATLKIDLGNRLLQRVTYENAAKGVQQDVTEVHQAAKLAQAKIISDVCSVFNRSAYGVKYIGFNILEGMKSTGHAIGSASDQTSQGLHYMGGLTYNTTSSFGSFVKSAIPQRRHFIRARNNALKIRTRLLRKSTAAKQGVMSPKPASLPSTLSSLKGKIAELNQQLLLGINAFKWSSLQRPSKSSLVSSMADAAVKTAVQMKSKMVTPLVADSSKDVKCRKQSQNTENKVKTSGV